MSGTLVVQCEFVLPLAAGTASTGDMGLMARGVRGGVSMKENPRSVSKATGFCRRGRVRDVPASLGLVFAVGLGIGSRLMTSVGAMESEGVIGFVASVVPLIVLGRHSL